MRTVIAIAIGFAVLLACTVLAPRRRRTVAALYFILFWMIACGVDLWYGVARAGYGFGEEVALHAAIFAIPTTAAWTVARKSSSPAQQ
jgi:hypothetical protein